MKSDTIKVLNQINTDFYARFAESFSGTRQQAWDGWETAMGSVFSELAGEDFGVDGFGGTGLGGTGLPGGGLDARDSAIATNLIVRDYACGNLRFEKFLSESYPTLDFTFFPIDNCLPLVQNTADLNFTELDIINNFDTFSPSPVSDLTVSFGFMHHIPSSELRLRFFKHLLSGTKTGGFIIVSFWQFMSDDRLAKQAKRITDEFLQQQSIDLENDDYFLGWKNQENAYRYCHNFSDSEIASMVSELNECELVNEFTADNCNKYLVLQKI
jgi:hypothetical protein